MYHINIFKDKVLYKKLKSYKSIDRAKKYFNNKVKDSNNSFFETQVKNTRPTIYEILLIEDSVTDRSPIFRIDEYGRNIKIKTDVNNVRILDVKPYKVPDKIYDLKKDKKITFNDFCNTYLKFKDLKVVFSLNNKIVVQRDINFYLFSTKNCSESIRFLNDLSKFCLNNGRQDVMVVIDTSVPQKKFLYKELVNIGYDIKMLYRKNTTYSERK